MAAEKITKQEIARILGQMTLEEKIALCSGQDNWHTKAYDKYKIPAIMMSDGPHGLRKQEEGTDMLGLNSSVPATCFPTASISACSWDEGLLSEVGGAIAEEAGANGVSVVLGPGVNIKRNPLCGRNFEYFSEDPVLSGRLGAAWVKGAQQKGIGASLKHFACNSQEYYRMSSDSLIDERTLRELYLSAFEYVVKEAKPATVMCSYNRINGTYSSENKWLLKDVLRGEWGYEGAVVTDWGAVGDRSAGFAAGCDLAMPGGSAYGETQAAENVKKGTLSEEDVDRCAANVLRLILNGHKALEGDFSYTAKEHHELAYQAAVKSAVLLKNEDNILPLRPGKKLCLIGRMAKEPRCQGSGSSHINPTRLQSICELWPDVPYATGYSNAPDADPELIREAKELAASSDVTVVCAGLTDLYESEGLDRENMKMPAGQLSLIETLAEVTENIVVVLYGGSAMETPWADRVKGILYMGLPGQAGAEAAIALLTGKENPSGKLAESWPYLYEDCPSASYYSGGNRDAEYREGLFAGYRYYDTAQVPVRWSFGYGLSYTTFIYSDLRTEGTRVFVTVENAGEVAGDEIVQLYLGMQEGVIFRPKQELKGFTKVHLKPGEKREVCFTLAPEDFRFWEDGWKALSGVYKVYAGGGLTGQMLSGEITLSDAWSADLAREQGQDAVRLMSPEEIAAGRGSAERKLWYAHPKGEPPRKDWEVLMGHPVPVRGVEKPYTLSTPLSDAMEGSAILKLVYRVYEKNTAKQSGRDSVQYKMTMAVIREVTLRAVQTANGMGGHVAEALVLIANGHLFAGIRRMLSK